jgi:hypothetical protein
LNPGVTGRAGIFELTGITKTLAIFFLSARDE